MHDQQTVRTMYTTVTLSHLRRTDDHHLRVVESQPGAYYYHYYY